MLTTKEIKIRARKTVRGHYLLLVALCVVTILFGNEFTSNSGVLNFQQLVDISHVQEEGIDQDMSHPLKQLTTAPLRDLPASDVVRDILNNDMLDGVALADSLEKQFESSGTDTLGHTDGVLAYTINTLASGTFAIKVFEGLNEITGSNEVSKIIFVLLGLLVYGFLFVAVPEVYVVALRRMFLEARVYEQVPLHHALHLLKVRRCVRATLTIIRMDIQYFLWSLTIAGFFIKRYSYYLVPYIVAENPDIRPGQAIAMSRRMMDGHKMEAFKFEMSFLHWLALGIVSLGLSNVFYYVPYKLSAVAEYYACIRQISKEAGIEGAELLDDPCLMAKADQSLLKATYQDTAFEQGYLEEHRITLTGAQKFFAEKLAIWLGRATDKNTYQEIENRQFRLTESVMAMQGLVYPQRLDPRDDESNRHVSYNVDFLRCYTIWNLMSMFFIFAAIGWVWEVVVFLVQTGSFVNRGTLYGPWIPIYGVGGALIIIVLSSLRKKPLAEFFAIMVLCGTIEYFTSWFLEEAHGMRWWDYSGYFLNLNGRICAEGLIAFAVLGLMAIYILAPALDSLLMKIDPRILAPVTSAIMLIFVGDVIYSQIHPHTGTGITDMGSVNKENTGNFLTLT